MPQKKRNHIFVFWAGLTAALLFGLSPFFVFARSTPSSHFNSFFLRREMESTLTSKKYIVVLKDTGSPNSVNDVLGVYHISPSHTYRSALSGFSAALTEELFDKLKKDSRVEFISEDREVHLLNLGESVPLASGSSGEIYPTGVMRIGAPNANLKGDGITVAVIDTGIDLTHPDLRENIVAHTNCAGFSASGNDDHGHGSHVAGTIAGRDNGIGVVGVVPRAKLVAVKVLNAGGSGTWSSVICGVDWVTAHAAEYNIKVANMSLGGWGSSDNNCGASNSDAFHRALCRSTAAGVVYVVAAGNWGTNATGTVPAAYDDTLITVSALADSDGKPFGMGTSTPYGADDTFAWFSNYGNVVDIGAPGVDIFSSYKNGQYAKMSGTSMASPHVASAAAAYFEANPGSTWREVRDGLRLFAYTFYPGHTDPSLNHPEPILRVNAIKHIPASSSNENRRTHEAGRQEPIFQNVPLQKSILRYSTRFQRAKYGQFLGH